MDEKVLLFSSNAWEKLLFFRDAVSTEIGCWGITAEDDDFYIEDVVMTPQHVTAVTVEFTDDGLAKFQSDMIAKNIPPYRCQKIWLHTHPGTSASPSSTDEDTIKSMIERISDDDHVVMFIIAKGGQTYCRLCTKTKKYGIMSSNLKVMYELKPERSDWKKEMDANILKKVYSTHTPVTYGSNNTSSHNTIGFQGQNNSNDLDSWRKDKEYNNVNTSKKKVDMPKDTGKDASNSWYPGDLAENVYAKYMIDSVKELNYTQTTELQSRFGPGISIYLGGLEEQFKDAQKLDFEMIQYMYRHFNVSSFKELTREEWKELICNYHVTRAYALQKEKQLVFHGEDNE